MRALLALPLLLAMLAGCTQDERGDAVSTQAGTLRFPGTWDVETTPNDPNEVRGPLRVTWTGGRLAVESTTEPDLSRRTIVDGGTVYISNAGMGWIRYDLQEGLRNGRLSNRLLLWDLPDLAADRKLSAQRSAAENGELVRMDGRVTRAGLTLDVDLTLLVADGEVREARLASSRGRESPYTFTPSASAITWADRLPTQVRPEREVIELDAKAREGHVQVVGLVRAYQQSRAGMLPETLDPDTLALELGTSGRGWPASPYDGQPLRNAERSGHFHWVRCSPNDGLYVGWGWDGLLHSQQFGPRGCPAAAPKA